MKGLSIIYASLLAYLTRCVISGATPPQSTNTSSTAVNSEDGLDNTLGLSASNPKYSDRILPRQQKSCLLIVK